MDMKKEREAFEKWAKNKGKYVQLSSDGSYVSMTLNQEFEAWQAAKASAVQEGFAVVPIEITPKQIEAYMKGKVFPASMGEHRKFVDRLSKDYKSMIKAAQEQGHG